MPGPTVALRSWPSAASAQLANGEHYVWGYVWPRTLDGQPFPALHTPVRVARAPQFTGNGHRCELDDAGRGFCSGDNRYGEVGDGTLEERLDFVPVALDAPLAGIEGPRWRTFGVLRGGGVVAWGEGRRLGLGDDAPERVPVPTRVPGLEDAIGVSPALGACAWSAAGEVWCWGVLGGLPRTQTPTRAPGLEPARKVAVGGAHTCVLKHDASVWCIGDFLVRGLGYDFPPSDVATRVPLPFDEEPGAAP